MSEKRRLILYIAMSLDGFIAKTGDDLSFLSIVAEPGEDYGYGSFINDIDTVIIGRKTYEWVMTQVDEFPHADKETYVITHTSRPTSGNIQFYNGNLKELVTTLKNKKGKNIFADGGATVVQALLKEKLIDEYYISIIPILLGEGTRLFEEGRPEQLLKLISARNFNSGLVQLHYINVEKN